MYNWMGLYRLEEETLGFYLLLSRVTLFCVLNCFVYYPLDRRKSKKLSLTEMLITIDTISLS